MGWLDKNGVFNLQKLFTSSAIADKKPEKPAKSDKKPFNIQVNAINLKNYQLHVEDRGPEKPVQLALSPLNLTIKNFNSAKQKPFTLALNSTLNKTGQLSSQGSVTLSPLNVNLTINTKNIPVNIIQPYVNDFAHLRIRRGELFVDGKLKLTEKQTIGGNFKGNIALRSLRTTDTLKGQDFLNWKTLSLTGLHYELEPAALSIDKVLADRLYSKILVEKDKSTNIGKIFISKPQTKKKKNQSRKTHADSYRPGVD